MSLQVLADTVGVSFQQIQKYEKGTIRISSGRLLQVANALGVPVSDFFPDGLTESLCDADTATLMRAFEEIPNRGVQRALVELVKAVAMQRRR